MYRSECAFSAAARPYLMASAWVAKIRLTRTAPEFLTAHPPAGFGTTCLPVVFICTSPWSARFGRAALRLELWYSLSRRLKRGAPSNPGRAEGSGRSFGHRSPVPPLWGPWSIFGLLVEAIASLQVRTREATRSIDEILTLRNWPVARPGAGAGRKGSPRRAGECRAFGDLGRRQAPPLRSTIPFLEEGARGFFIRQGRDDQDVSVVPPQVVQDRIRFLSSGVGSRQRSSRRIEMKSVRCRKIGEASRDPPIARIAPMSTARAITKARKAKTVMQKADPQAQRTTWRRSLSGMLGSPAVQRAILFARTDIAGGVACGEVGDSSRPDSFRRYSYLHLRPPTPGSSRGGSRPHSPDRAWGFARQRLVSLARRSTSGRRPLEPRCLRENVCLEGESLPIGVVPCADKDAEEVYYATGNL